MLISFSFDDKDLFKHFFAGKKRKAIVKGSSVVEFGKSANSGASFLGVGLMSEYLPFMVIISKA